MASHLLSLGTGGLSANDPPSSSLCCCGLLVLRSYSLDRREERTYRVDRFIEVSAPQAPEHIEPPPVELPYGHPSHPEVHIRLTARGVLLMERDRHLGDSIQPSGEEGGLLCFRCPEVEYGCSSATCSPLCLIMAAGNQFLPPCVPTRTRTEASVMRWSLISAVLPVNRRTSSSPCTSWMPSTL